MSDPLSSISHAEDALLSKNFDRLCQCAKVRPDGFRGFIVPVADSHLLDGLVVVRWSLAIVLNQIALVYVVTVDNCFMQLAVMSLMVMHCGAVCQYRHTL